VPKIQRRRSAGPPHVTRAEFDAVINVLNERGDIINDVGRKLREQLRELAAHVEGNERELRTQFTRIAQLQVEIDALKRRR
jgi:hypothetical protein